MCFSVYMYFNVQSVCINHCANDQCKQDIVGPGLAQLVKSLTHRYSESTISNPGNLTSATVCGDRTGGAPAAKRSTHVAPEVDLGECTLHSPPQKANKVEPTLALKPRRDVTRNIKQVYQWPQKKDMCICPPKTFLKNVNRTLRLIFVSIGFCVFQGGFVDAFVTVAVVHTVVHTFWAAWHTLLSALPFSGFTYLLIGT